MHVILVVDDSKTERLLCAGILEQSFDCKVEFAGNGQEALAVLENGPVDVVLTDLNMPIMDGLRLVEEIRDAYSSVPVILMTGKGSESIAAEALRKGAWGYVPKSHLVDDLIPTIRRVAIGAFHDKSHSQLMHQLAECQLRFELLNDLTLIPQLIRHVQEMLRCLPLEDEVERNRVGMALEEAVKNAMLHGNLEIDTSERSAQRREELAKERFWQRPYFDRRVTVQINITREAATFRIQNQGPEFDPTNHLSEEFDGEALFGRGIRLMTSFMDQVNYENSGRTVVMTKWRVPTESD